MTGPIVSVLGVCVEQSVAMFRGDLTEYFKTAPGDCALAGGGFRDRTGRRLYVRHPCLGALEAVSAASAADSSACQSL